jgi:hypothetical protein
VTIVVHERSELHQLAKDEIAAPGNLKSVFEPLIAA